MAVNCIRAFENKKHIVTILQTIRNSKTDNFNSHNNITKQQDQYNINKDMTNF